MEYEKGDIIAYRTRGEGLGYTEKSAVPNLPLKGGVIQYFKDAGWGYVFNKELGCLYFNDDVFMLKPRKTITFI